MSHLGHRTISIVAFEEMFEIVKLCFVQGQRSNKDHCLGQNYHQFRCNSMYEHFPISILALEGYL